MRLPLPEILLLLRKDQDDWMGGEKGKPTSPSVSPSPFTEREKGKGVEIPAYAATALE
jgi:hypothetical protein